MVFMNFTELSFTCQNSTYPCCPQSFLQLLGFVWVPYPVVLRLTPDSVLRRTQELFLVILGEFW